MKTKEIALELTKSLIPYLDLSTDYCNNATQEITVISEKACNLYETIYSNLDDFFSVQDSQSH